MRPLTADEAEMVRRASRPGPSEMSPLGDRAEGIRPAIARPLVVGDPVAFVRARRRGHPRAGVVTEVGTVCEINDIGNGRRSVSVVTAWVHGDGSDQRLDGTTRWLLPESWCTRIVARAAKGGAR